MISFPCSGIKLHLLGTNKLAPVKLVSQLILNFQFKKFNVEPQMMPKRPTELASCIEGGWYKKRAGEAGIPFTPRH